MATRPLLLGLVAVSVALAAGCSPDKPKGVATSSPAVVPSATPSLDVPDAAERDALAAYRGMWRAFVEAGKTSDAESTELRTFASGNALKLIVSSLYTNKELGKITKGEVSLAPKVVTRTPDAATATMTIEDCVDSTRWLEYKVSGGLWDNKPGGKHRTTAIVKKQQGGTWKVDAFALRGSGTC